MSRTILTKFGTRTDAISIIVTAGKAVPKKFATLGRRNHSVKSSAKRSATPGAFLARQGHHIAGIVAKLEKSHSLHDFVGRPESLRDKLLREFTKTIFAALSLNHSLRDILGDIA